MKRARSFPRKKQKQKGIKLAKEIEDKTKCVRDIHAGNYRSGQTEAPSVCLCPGFFRPTLSRSCWGCHGNVSASLKNRKQKDAVGVFDSVDGFVTARGSPRATPGETRLRSPVRSPSRANRNTPLEDCFCFSLSSKEHVRRQIYACIQRRLVNVALRHHKRNKNFRERRCAGAGLNATGTLVSPGSVPLSSLSS